MVHRGGNEEKQLALFLYVVPHVLRNEQRHKPFRLRCRASDGSFHILLTSSGMALPSNIRCRMDMHWVFVSNDPELASTMMGGTAPDTIIACRDEVRERATLIPANDGHFKERS